MKKHRLALLLGILVALVFFYFGLNTWIESQQKISPPPVAQFRPPVEMKKQAQPVKPKTPETTPAPARTEGKLQEMARLPEPEEKVTKQGSGELKEREEKTQRNESAQKQIQKKVVEEKKVAKKTPPVKKPVAKKTLKSYILQIGAFRSKSNAQRLVAKAKSMGYKAFIVEEGGLYKVRIKVNATGLISALKKARKDFGNAFAVKK